MPASAIAPTKSNLMKVKERLVVALEGYELLEEKREILVMELMRRVEQVKLLEKNLERKSAEAYPALKRLLLAVGRERAEEMGHGVRYDYRLSEKRVSVAGMSLPSLEVRLPKLSLQYSFMNSFADMDETMVKFLDFLASIVEMASVRSVVWRLAGEVKKTQRRVNALEKVVIPQARTDRSFIENSLEERERESLFIQKRVKARRETEALG